MLPAQTPDCSGGANPPPRRNVRPLYRYNTQLPVATGATLNRTERVRRFDRLLRRRRARPRHPRIVVRAAPSFRGVCLHPLALQLTRAAQDRGFEVVFDLSRDRRVGPLPGRRAFLTVDGHRNRV
jgi:hypothetical protein